MNSELFQNLKDVLGDVNEWLRFAEAKNGLLVTVTLALVVGIAAVPNEDQLKLLGHPSVPTIVSILLCVSASIALLSFFPQLRPHQETAKPPKKPVNLLYFGTIAGLNSKDYLQLFQTATNCQSCGAEILLQISNQIVTNSQIALYKFNVFTWALRVALSALIFGLVAPLIIWMVGQ